MKKVITIVSLSLVGILILTTIILSCITVGAKINYGSPEQLVIYHNDLKTSMGVSKVNKDDKADEVIKTLTDATKQKYLPALFNKTLDNVSVETNESRAYISRNNTSDSKVVFEFKYGDEEQTIKVDGESISFYSLIFEIEESQEKSTIKIYAISENVSSDSVAYFSTIKVTGEFAETYLMIKGFVDEYIA